MSEILANLQIAEGIAVVDYPNILNIAFEIYEQISKQLVENGDKDALAKILITGICPNDNSRSFLFEFAYKLDQEGITYYSREIDLNSISPYFIGDEDAISYFKEKLTHDTNYLQLLKEICKNPEFETVGG
ncbi:MAG: hypothetical protein EBZ47_09575, partial [Chlamydiae bacterium]|nr:hypothetical protein [Chlamydiota bacterium]